MKKEQVTILVMKDLYEGELEVGTEISFQKEPSNKHDKDAVMVFSEDKQVGYIGNNKEKGTILEGTLSATELTGEDFSKGSIKELISKDNYITKYKAEILLEKKEALKEIEFSLIGGISTFPGKTELLSSIEDGNKIVTIKRESDNLIGYYKDEACGRVKTTENIENILTDFIEDSKEVQVRAISKSRGNINCKLRLNKKTKVRKKRNLKEIMENITSKGIDTKKNLDEKLKYLTQNKVSENNIADIFDTYIKYDEDIEVLISKPETPYIDSGDLVNDCIININGKNNLIFEGDKGVGKNTLADTLGWLYKRPVYEFSLNAQQSNHALFGGDTFKKVDIDEKDKSLLSETVKKIISGQLDKDVDITTSEAKAFGDFIVNKLASDEELVFETSPILEGFINGGFVVLDELNTAQASVMTALHSILDKRRRFEITGLGKVIGHDNFIAIGTQNKGYEGTFKPNEATLDRFEPIIFPKLESISSVLEKQYPDLGYETIDACNKIYKAIKISIEGRDIGADCLTIRGFEAVCDNVSRGMNLKTSLIRRIAHRAYNPNDKELIENIIDLQIKD